MISGMMTVVYFSILQHKIVFLLPDGTFRVGFYESVITTDKVVSTDLIVFNMHQ
jgi:hypothetical protein